MLYNKWEKIIEYFVLKNFKNVLILGKFKS